MLRSLALAAAATGAVTWKLADDHDLMKADRVLKAASTCVTMGVDYKLNFPAEDDPNYKAKRHEVHLRNAQRLLEGFMSLGGIYIKVGQHLSSLVYLLPDEYTSTMVVTQSAAPRSSYEAVVRVVESELAASLSDVYSDFEREPIASASLAQVHVAKLKDTGEKVAVKVQHEHLQAMCDVDVAVITKAVEAASFFFPSFKFGWLLEEFHENLPKELNFVTEAHHSEKVVRVLGDYPNLRVPKIHWNATRKRVLTMEFVDGVKIDDVAGLRRIGVEPQDALFHLTHIFSRMMFVTGFVHCDPHPGNVHVRKASDGSTQIVLFDHGLYKQLDDDFRLLFCQLWMAIVDQDETRIKELSKAMGVSYYELFASMLTARSWNVITDDLMKERTDEERALLQTGSGMLQEITDVLSSVPRQLLLVLKTNDLLRAISHNLGLFSSFNTFTINTRYCYYALEKARTTTASSPVSIPSQVGSWVSWLAFETTLRVKGALLWLWGM